MSIAYYKESGHFNPLSATTSFLILMVTALLVGYAYAAISLFNPVVYLNVVILIGVGLGFSWLTTAAFDLFKIRNQRLRVSFVGTAGLVAWYSQWCVTMDYLVFEEIVSIGDYLISLLWILELELFFENLKIAYDYGYYETFGMTIKGPILLIIWLVELVIFIGYPVFAILKHVPRPYSNHLESWYPKYVLEKQFRVVTGSNSFVQELSEDPVGKIANLSAGRGDKYSLLHIFLEPQEREQYITVVNHSYDKEKSKINKEFVVQNLSISTLAAKEILATYSHQKK